MPLQLASFIFDCTCIILPTLIVHIGSYCYLYYSTLFIPFTALYFVLHLSYTLKKGHFENKPFIVTQYVRMSFNNKQCSSSNGDIILEVINYMKSDINGSTSYRL